MPRGIKGSGPPKPPKPPQKDRLKCRLCGQGCQTDASLARHVNRNHQITLFVYYRSNRRDLQLRVLENVHEVTLSESLGPCWEYQGRAGRGGYRDMRVNGAPTMKAHRLSYWAFKGEMPTNLLLHQCDNPACVNPNHMKDGTHQENMAERQERQRQSRGPSHYATTLTEIDVKSIRLRRTWGHTCSSIGQDFGLTKSAVEHIVAYRSFGHVEYDPEYDGNFIPF